MNNSKFTLELLVVRPYVITKQQIQNGPYEQLGGAVAYAIRLLQEQFAERDGYHVEPQGIEQVKKALTEWLRPSSGGKPCSVRLEATGGPQGTGDLIPKELLEQCRRANDLLRALIHRLEKELTELNSSLVRTGQQLTQCQQTVQTLSQQNQDLLGQLADQKSEAEKAKRKFEEALAEAARQIEQVKKDAKEQIDALREERKELRNKLDDFEIKVVPDLERKLTMKEQEMEEIRSEIDALRRDLKLLQQTQPQIGELMKTVSDCTAQLRRLDDRVTALERAVASASLSPEIGREPKPSKDPIP